jgi:hypothetical protein
MKFSCCTGACICTIVVQNYTGRCTLHRHHMSWRFHASLLTVRSGHTHIKKTLGGIYASYYASLSLFVEPITVDRSAYEMVLYSTIWGRRMRRVVGGLNIWATRLINFVSTSKLVNWILVFVWGKGNRGLVQYNQHGNPVQCEISCNAASGLHAWCPEQDSQCPPPHATGFATVFLKPLLK